MAKNKIANSSTNNENNITNTSNANINSNNGNNGVKVKRKRKSVPRESPSQRSSIYRGVTRHRWTGRYEAHLWDKNCWNESQNKKGRQVYLGAYDDEEAAAHAYDLAALKYWGHETILNFPLNTYQEELNEMDGQSKEEYIGSLRRKSSGFSRGVSKYRGVARHHHNGRWEARIGRVFGNKYLYLGTYATQEEAATAYDMAAIEYRGLNAVTNFDLSRYIKWLRPNSDNSQSNTQTNNTIIGNSSLTNIVHDHDLNSNNNNNSQTQRKQENTADVSSSSTITHSGSGSGSATSALSLLFQSPKFKEMLEQSSAISHPCDSMAEAENKASKCSFPDDIQTYFGCHDGIAYAEGDDAIFGDFTTFASPVIQFEFDE